MHWNRKKKSFFCNISPCRCDRKCIVLVCDGTTNWLPVISISNVYTKMKEKATVGF